jgi:transposase-like protein
MTRRGYPPEFRRRVVELVEGGRKVAEVAADLRISEQTIYTWRRQAVYFGGGEWETIRPWLGRVSKRERSRLSGVPERRLREYLQGARRPPMKRLGTIAAALVRMLDEGGE